MYFWNYAFMQSVWMATMEHFVIRNVWMDRMVDNVAKNVHVQSISAIMKLDAKWVYSF